MTPEQLKAIDEAIAAARTKLEGQDLGVIMVCVQPEGLNRGAFQVRHTMMDLTTVVGALHRAAHVLQTPKNASVILTPEALLGLKGSGVIQIPGGEDNEGKGGKN